MLGLWLGVTFPDLGFSSSSSQVYSALKELKNLTVLLISHRLSGVEKADHIIFLREGEVAEEGNHVELMAKHGFYEEFEKQQNTSIHRNTEDVTNSGQWSRPAALHLIWASTNQITNPCTFSPLAHIHQLFNYVNATSVFKLGVNITTNARKDMGESH